MLVKSSVWFSEHGRGADDLFDGSGAVSVPLHRDSIAENPAWYCGAGRGRGLFWDALVMISYMVKELE